MQMGNASPVGLHRKAKGVCYPKFHANCPHRNAGVQNLVRWIVTATVAEPTKSIRQPGLRRGVATAPSATRPGRSAGAPSATGSEGVRNAAESVAPSALTRAGG